ncbi:2-keto-4-pentenoate hydratase [Psychrobacter pygoscelis]|uniref:2-keto-4-pentenoate hydratase n=1 Tax=Psychrobacter pygoscelis TaxID=2488563 RepID=UPI00103FCD8C|nr:fumarylacetoacetate hydrolase [Psychrobacter pygoscelis]
MTTLTPEQLAEQLYNAYRDQLSLPKSVFIDDMDVEQAYQIQHQVTAQKVANGATLAGYKISMTSERTMALFASTNPMYGQLTDRQLLENNAQLSLNTDVNDALVELELAFIVQEIVLPTDDIEDICRKCLIAPALEVPDCRYQDWFANMSKEHLCADSAVAGYLCLGDAQSMSVDKIGAELGKLTHGSELLLTEPASVVLKHPAKAVQWLVQKLESHGLKLDAGMVVSSGSFGMPVPLKSGEYVGQFQQTDTVRLRVV